jgi:hypothetical protein
MALRKMHVMMVAGAAAVALVAGGTAAGAALASSPSGPIDSSGVVHGCYAPQGTKGGYLLELQKAGTGCPKGSTAISWSQKGPQGPTGATGARGATGATGPQGPAGAGLVYTTASGMNGPTVATAGAYSIDVELALDNLSDSSAVLTCDVKGVPTATPQTPVPEFAQSYDVGAGSGLPEGPVNVFTLSGIATLNQKTSLTMLCYDAAGDAVQAQSALWYVAPLQTG